VSAETAQLVVDTCVRLCENVRYHLS